MRRLLIGLPIIFSLVLLQSYFWVPTYEEQARGNPARLHHYIEASIGDAQILNPILSADMSSAQIEAKVFEGLIDRDENLNFRGRLARGWDIYEEAYFYPPPDTAIPGLGQADPAATAGFLRAAAQDPGRFPEAVAQSLSAIREISLEPARFFEIQRKAKGPAGKPETLTIKVSAPPRIRLVLKDVDQDLFEHLAIVLGPNYFSGFDGARFLEAQPARLAGNPQDLAAELLPAVEHNPVIVFHLRPGVRFHDGRPLSAQDVRFTYEAIMNPANLSPRLSDYEPVKKVDVVDPLTVRIVYRRLFSPALGTWAMGILPSHLMNAEALRKEAIERHLDPETFTLRQSRLNRRPVGSGPFRFAEWQSDQFIRLDRFERYWEGAPNFHGFIYRIIPDLFTQEMEFYAGTIDSYQVQPHQVDRLEADPRFQSFSGLSFAYAYIGYNQRRAPFDDVRVRTALGLAIDTESIINHVLHHQGERITGPFLKQTDYYDTRIEPLPYDPQKALELLAAAGWQRNSQGWLEKDGRRLQFTLITNQGNDIRKAILSIAQNAWRKIGVDVRTDVLEWAVFIQERVNKNDFDALVLGWTQGIEPDLYQLFHSSQTLPGQLNFVGFKDRQADDLIIRIRREYNHQRQVEMCHRLQAIIAREQPYTFLYAGRWTAVLDKRIVIQARDPQGHRRYEKIEPTPTGDYTFFFNQWVKLAQAPRFEKE
jgi:ABC-type transport system substrate-binding protein